MRLFIYDDLLPSEIAKRFQDRELIFDSAYVVGYRRCFRSVIEGSSGIATLIKREKYIEFGYIVSIPEPKSSVIDEIYSSISRSKIRVTVGFGDGELGSAHAYILQSPLKYADPAEKVRRNIAEWKTRFWPSDTGEPIRAVEIPLC